MRHLLQLAWVRPNTRVISARHFVLGRDGSPSVGTIPGRLRRQAVSLLSLLPHTLSFLHFLFASLCFELLLNCGCGRFDSAIMIPSFARLGLSLATGVALSTYVTSTAAQAPGTFEVVGDTLVSAMVRAMFRYLSQE